MYLNETRKQTLHHLLFGGGRAHAEKYFPELRRMAVISQSFALASIALVWAFIPVVNTLDMAALLYALAGIVLAIGINVGARTIAVLKLGGALGMCAIACGFRLLAEGAGQAEFWMQPVGVFMVLLAAPIFNGCVVYLMVAAAVWLILGYGHFPIDPAMAHAAWANLLIVYSMLFGLVLSISFNLLRLRDFRAREALTRLAYQDGLTGLNNRRRFTELTQQLQQQRQPMYFLMIDIDNFKKINDTLGHDAGDVVLVKTAAIIADACGGHLCGRLGGEEFGIVYAGDRRAVCQFAASLVDAVYLAFNPGQAVSISVGIAELACDTELAHSYRLADASLYQAKHQGKNRYVIA